MGTQGLGPSKQETATNISLAGVYFETEQGEGYSVNEVLTTSVAIPESQSRVFPFRRVAGRGRVVRVHELPQQEGASRTKRFGVALEFGEDIIALTALPTG